LIHSNVVIVGAGPYGLSLAAHLARCKVPHRIFGQPMKFWSQIADAGGERFLKSFCFGTSISAPVNGQTFTDYNAARGLEIFEPCSIDNFVQYGLWFAQHNVNWTDSREVMKISRHNEAFAVELEDGVTIEASRVVVATGLSGYAQIPQEFASLGELAVHTSAIRRFSDFLGLDVAVIGAGQSALEAVALLNEAGAKPQLIFRDPAIRWMSRTPSKRSLWKRIRSPLADLGSGPSAWALTNFAGAVHFFPTTLRTSFVKNHLPPEGAWWLRSRVEGQFPFHNETRVIKAGKTNGRVVLTLDKCGHRCENLVDRVILGTGYQVDIEKLGFLATDLREGINTIEQAPKLDANFESSVPGLFFLGPVSAMSFGPLFRFVAGTGYSSRVVSRRLASSMSERCRTR
jgi:hypothetical protein